MNLLHSCSRIGIALAATAWLSVATAEIDIDGGDEAEAPEFVLEKISYAADHCLQLRRWVEDEQLPTDADDAEAMLAASAAVAANAAGNGNGNGGVAGTGSDAEDEESTEDDDAPELYLSSRFNGEACDAREDGAVIEDKTDLPIVIDAVRTLHTALTVAPEWIDEEKLPLELKGCWRKGAKLDNAVVDKEESLIELDLEVTDCEGKGRGVRLSLPLPKPGERSDYRRDKAIVAEERIWFVCGTGLLEEAEAEAAEAGK